MMVGLDDVSARDDWLQWKYSGPRQVGEVY